MVQSSLRVKPRIRIGKSGAREVRKEGNIPAILYGQGEDPVPLVVRPDELKRALSNNTGINTVLELEIDGSEPSAKRFSMLKEVQRDPIKNRVIHLDFLAIDMKKSVRVKVPVSTQGRSEGERRGGTLEKLMRTIDLECLPENIPDLIEIDISSLDIGGFVDIGGLELGEGVKPVRDGSEKVVQVIAQRSTEEDVQAGEEEGEGEGEAEETQE
ncbi:MAG: 50S ribosomal protein L25 [Candidatus Dadabacteria bacterium]|nr:50S ribosomal protein L25 [Candidatus Dadabacteria bacterium]MXZ47722.1 50S ribosomal protein L25 [Candidatus Dadabacteria bacterium]MYB27266.1 50S ribosomal protein L25 [Candidatus Dadabacteria bacterium]MYE61155.1 50S ribosomal protein L25 [Candidatus Dadabacteria bacterium]MYI72892.1 50S ribosomal protein L25 [Candidatus Dadabacteria bacterium]